MSQPISIERKTYTIDEIVIILGIPKTAVYKLLKKEYFIAFKLGREYRISRESFDNWLSGSE